MAELRQKKELDNLVSKRDKARSTAAGKAILDNARFKVACRMDIVSDVAIHFKAKSRACFESRCRKKPVSQNRLN